MSERIFAFLLRLYPAHFRQQYGTEAIQLLRDRLRDERGAGQRLRLWIDLLADFAAGLPQAYRNSYAATAPLPQPGNGLPAFRMLEEEPLRPGSVLAGSVVAIAAVAAFVFVMNHAAAYHSFSGASPRLGAASGGFEANDAAQNAAEKQQTRSVSPQQACAFEKLEQHPGNIGYIKLNWFADPVSCREVAVAVLNRLSETDTIIFDLRNNHGGNPEMARFIAGALFEHPVPWYNPGAIAPAQLITSPLVAGNRPTSQPVFLLTSPRTSSAAEHFAYNLKMLKRAIIVGETTSGASHGGSPRRDEIKPVWESTGVEPDVKVKAADALKTAEVLAQKKLASR